MGAERSKTPQGGPVMFTASSTHSNQRTARAMMVATVVLLMLSACTTSTKAAKDATTAEVAVTVPVTVATPTTGGPTIPAPVATTVKSVTAAPTTARQPAATTAAPATTAVPKPPAPNPCSAIDFRNFTFDLPDFGKITATNGQGERGTRDSVDYAALQVRGVVAGDFGGVDGNAETAVFTNVNTGGTGQLSDVHIYSCAGTTATRLTSAGVGDRADEGVRGISIKDDALAIDRFTDAQGACCPTAVVRQGFRLNGGALSPIGSPAKRKYLSLEAGQTEIPISFLPGTSGAVFFGDTAVGSTGGFDAAAGQKLTLSLEPPYPNNGTVIIDVLMGDRVLVSVESGATKTIDLPAKAHYVLKPRPAAAGADAGYDGEMTIT
jgi:hypothetical protein